MDKQKKTPVVINDKEYIFEDMTDEQKAHVNHIADLDRKITNSRFNIEQLEFGRKAFMDALSELLDK
jgi:hypothetical protein|tara:strand:+ start:976 stop:1176 length:201 start_codon:yes stop_codon:yes gene_type:complete